MSRTSVFRRCCSCGQQGHCPPPEPQTQTWPLEHLDKGDQRRDNPHPRAEQIPHPSTQPSPAQPPLLLPVGVRGGCGAACAQPRPSQPLAGTRFPASFVLTGYAGACFHVGNHITNVSAPTLSAWLSQNPQIITGGDNRCSCPAFNDNQFSLWHFAK